MSRRENLRGGDGSANRLRVPGEKAGVGAERLNQVETLKRRKSKKPGVRKRRRTWGRGGGRLQDGAILISWGRRHQRLFVKKTSIAGLGTWISPGPAWVCFGGGLAVSQESANLRMTDVGQGKGGGTGRIDP